MNITEETIAPLIRKSIQRTIDDCITAQVEVLIHGLCQTLFGDQGRVPDLLRVIRIALVTEVKNWVGATLAEGVGTDLVEYVWERINLPRTPPMKHVEHFADDDLEEEDEEISDDDPPLKIVD